MFTRVPWTFYFGSDGANDISPASDTVGNTVDTSKWNMMSVAKDNCPLLKTTPSGKSCKTDPSSIVAKDRSVTMTAYWGHYFMLLDFIRQGSFVPSSTRFPMQNGAPLMEAKLTFGDVSKTKKTMWEATITGFNDGTNANGWNYNRQTNFGIQLYDYDAYGRVRPIFRAAVYEYWARSGAFYPSCYL